jgi:hypothetical protein
MAKIDLLTAAGGENAGDKRGQNDGLHTERLQERERIQRLAAEVEGSRSTL